MRNTTSTRAWSRAFTWNTHCHEAALVCVTLPWFSVRSSALELELWLPVFTASRCYIVNSPVAAHLEALTVCFARRNLVFQCLRLLLKSVHKIGWIELFGFDLITAGDHMQSATSHKPLATSHLVHYWFVFIWQPLVTIDHKFDSIYFNLGEAHTSYWDNLCTSHLGLF